MEIQKNASLYSLADISFQTELQLQDIDAVYGN